MNTIFVCPYCDAEHEDHGPTPLCCGEIHSERRPAYSDNTDDQDNALVSIGICGFAWLVMGWHLLRWAI